MRIMAPAVVAVHATGATKEDVARVLRDAAGLGDGPDPLIGEGKEKGASAQEPSASVLGKMSGWRWCRLAPQQFSELAHTRGDEVEGAIE